MGDDGKPRLGRFGELLDADRNQVLGMLCGFKYDIDLLLTFCVTVVFVRQEETQIRL